MLSFLPHREIEAKGLSGEMYSQLNNLPNYYTEPPAEFTLSQDIVDSFGSGISQI